MKNPQPHDREDDLGQRAAEFRITRLALLLPCPRADHFFGRRGVPCSPPTDRHRLGRVCEARRASALAQYDALTRRLEREDEKAERRERRRWREETNERKRARRTRSMMTEVHVAALRARSREEGEP